MTQSDKNTETFEGALARLEEIVRMLESGNAALDASLSVFEEGTALVKQCNSQLDNAEQKIKILMQKQDGSYAEQDWQQN
ncbi:MAG: exodeoxyribonuclease VII small subunit [Clostridia bacterium]|nr:exodeoxyribonuclease VII small subunit [Clostridia bacterium]